MLHVIDAWFQLNGVFFVFVLSMFLLILAVGKADNEARAATRGKNVQLEISLLQTVAATTYRAAEFFMMLSSIVIQIKCYSSSWYYFQCAVAAGGVSLLHNIRSVRAIVSVCTAVYIVHQSFSVKLPTTEGVLHHQVSSYGSGLLSTGLGRSLLVWLSTLSDTLSHPMPRIVQEPNIILHTTLIAVPDVLHCWFHWNSDSVHNLHNLVFNVSMCVRGVASGSSKMGIYIAMLSWRYMYESTQLDYALRAPYQQNCATWLLCGAGVAASVHAVGYCAMYAKFVLLTGVRAYSQVLDLATTGALMATVAMTSSTFLPIVHDIFSAA
jgi:hypothetical protein